MAKVAIIHHSGFGHTDVLAQEVVAGVRAGGGEAVPLRIEAEQHDFATVFADLADADAVIFGSPTYFGTVSAPMKAFMDGSGPTFFAQGWKDKLAAAFTVSGAPSGDKLNTLTTFAIFAAQHGMIWVGPAQLPGNMDDTAAATDAENRLGGSTGVMAQAAQDSPDVTPRAGDRATARSLGVRMAQAAARWRAGANGDLPEPALAG